MNNPPNSINDKEIRLRVQDAIQRYGYKQVDVARETGSFKFIIGIHHSTLSLWLQGKIKGHYVKVPETLEEWLQNLYANKPRFSKSKPLDENENYNEALIPIRIDIEIESNRYRENICWNFYENSLSPEAFAKILAEENSLSSSFEHEIANIIKRNIASFKPFPEKKEEALRVIELDIRIDNVCLQDRFEWDINDPFNSPEEFAYLMCNDLGLNEEFAAQIAHSIREQVLFYKRQQDEGKERPEDKKITRSFAEAQFQGSFQATGIGSRIITEGNWLRFPGGHSLENTDNWEPKIRFVGEDDIQRLQKQEDRKNRYARRRV